MCPFHTLKRAYVINSTELVFLRLRHQHATIKLFSFIVVFEAEIDISDKEFRIDYDYQILDHNNSFALNDIFIFMDVNIQMHIRILVQKQQIVIRHL